MAKRSARTDPREAAEEAAALVGEETVEAAGERVVVRAHAWIDGVRLRAEARELVDAILETTETARDEHGRIDGTRWDYWQWLEAIVAHYGAFSRLLENATGRDTAWLEALPDADAHRVLDAYWRVNRDFFGRRVAETAMSRALGSPGSSPNSSPQATSSRTSGATATGS